MSAKEHDLQTKITVLQKKLIEHERLFFPVVVLNDILTDLLEHHKTHLNDLSTTLPQSIQGTLYVIDNGSTIMLPERIVPILESILLGRLRNYEFDLSHGDTVSLSIHDSRLVDDRPMILLQKQDNSILQVHVQKRHRKHAFLCKNMPAFPGYIFDKDKISQWSKSIFLNGTPQFHCSHQLLEELVSLWLGRKIKQTNTTTLTIDPPALSKFLFAYTHDTSARCHLICTGQTTIYIFLVLTSSDGCQRELARIHIGSTD